MHSLIHTHRFSRSRVRQRKLGVARLWKRKRFPVSQHCVCFSFVFTLFFLLSFSNNVKQALNSFTRERGSSIYNSKKKISHCCLLKLMLLSVSWCIMKNIICRKSGGISEAIFYVSSLFLHAIVFQGFLFSASFTINFFLIELCKNLNLFLAIVQNEAFSFFPFSFEIW